MSGTFKIIICGAGIAGLCAGIALGRQGHQIIILERAQALSPVGAGIHLPPNATLLLEEWGILEKLQGKAVVPAGFTFRRYRDSFVLARSGFTNGRTMLSTPSYWSLKRADYQQALYEAAVEVGCDIQLGCKVSGIDEDGPSLAGMKSALRQMILGDDAKSNLQPLATYRAWAPLESLEGRPDVKSLFNDHSANVWLGPARHMIVYPAEGGKILSINGTYPSHNDEAGGWNHPASVEEILSRFHDFDPAAKAILSKARDCKSWALSEVPRLSRWTSKSMKVILIGDAAHGMLQFLAQGAAMATEDAGALAECVGNASSVEDIPRITAHYERSRKWRCEKVQAHARRNGEFIHMPDGEEQEHRDRKLTGTSLPDDEFVDTGPLLDTEFVSWLYGHDTMAHTAQVIASGVHH
ncbi:hypothetical protein OPT61_g2835 [Boeremia exigua]|uniref:Uncharacterized protein n=1 Tax=Boeremia exigua TaxID=749465 RepID=A0ACC2IK18_9PLEO|nr:hypothetical protein OPT61_g2835 [Boeremia exigua]